MRLSEAFFTPEMGAKLRDLRKRARLTQAGVAERMGMRYSSARGFVSQLEFGRSPHPLLETIVLYLKACGAPMREFFDQFDRIEYVEVSRKLDRVWDAAGLVIAGVTGEKQARAQADVKAEIGRRVGRAAQRYQRDAVRPNAGKPVESGEARRRTERMAEYRVQASVVDRAVFEYLKDTSLPTGFYPAYRQFATSVFSVVRRESGKTTTEGTEEAQRTQRSGEGGGSEEESKEQKAKSKEQSDAPKPEGREQNVGGRTDGEESKEQRAKSKEQSRLEEKWKFVERQGLSPEIARKVQGIVMEVWEKIRK
jgi:transcriptional regulator with XRE-family HTH domain